MCLAVPGKILSIHGDDALSRSGQVRFGETIREASLAFVPEASVGDYVLVHAGVAITVVCQDGARRTLDYLKDIE